MRRIAVAVGRWTLAAGAAVLAFVAALHISLFALFFSAFPKDLAEPTAGVLMTALPVMAGAVLAPRARLVAGVVVCLLAAIASLSVLGADVIGGLAGGLVALAFVAWWFHPRRPRRATMWIGAAAGMALVAFAGLVYARYIDAPARPDALPSELREALGPNATGVAFYRYDLGGFIDREWLWRLDAKPDVVALVVGGLALRASSDVPAAFWRMPPHYWPRSMPPGAEAFQSRDFSADTRGPDGVHYFLLHDKTGDRAFVWLKNNF
jgi:hypothetical protein